VSLCSWNMHLARDSRKDNDRALDGRKRYERRLLDNAFPRACHRSVR
jgi:hypothetical protein